MQPYDNSRPKQEQVNEMFDTIAHRYDRLNHILSLGIDRRWRAKLVKKLAKNNPSRVLDVATGTADLAIAIARKIPSAEVTGLDPSANMLAIGRKKIEQKGLTDRIELLEGESEHLPFADGSFNGVTAAFGVRNFHDIEGGLRQMHRVLQKGGHIYILEFSTPRGWFFGPIYSFYFHRVLPVVGGWISGDRKAYTYLPSSVDEFPDGERFLEIMRAVGFSQASSRRLMGGIATIYSAVRL